MRMPCGEAITTAERTTYRLDLEYDGSDFAGWQIQPGERTVQQCLEDAVWVLFGEKISVMGAGRTDAGVHAVGQVASFRSTTVRPPQVVTRALNALLPFDVRVKAASVEEPEFHARYSACWRAYRYRVAWQPVAIGRAYSWNYPYRLDVPHMQAAARHILGDRPFHSFAHASEKEQHYLSSVYRAEWRECGPCYEFQIEANRFLHGMVRFLVGTFVRIGRGIISADQLPEILAAQDVRLAAAKAPARGLTLIAVGYEPWTAERRIFEPSAVTLC